MRAETKELRAAVGAVYSAISRRPGIPALSGIMVDAEPGSIRLRATDLETSAEVTLEAECEVDGETWRALIPGAMLKDALRAFKGSVFSIRPEGPVATLNGTGSVRLLPAEDWPTLQEPGEVAGTFDAGRLREALTSVGIGCSSDEARPVLTGMLLELDAGYLRLTATDSYVLIHAELAGAATEHKAIVPGHVPATVAKLIGAKGKGKVLVRGLEDVATFEVRLEGKPAVLITSRLIEGEFPNYRQLLPEPGIGDALRYDAAGMLDALAAVTPYCGQTNPMRLELNGTVIIAGESPDLGTYRATVPDADWDGPELGVAFNPAYFAGCVKAMAGAVGVRAEIRDGLKPAFFRAAGDGLARVALVMPVRMPSPIDVGRTPVEAPWCASCTGPLDRTADGGGPAEHAVGCVAGGDAEPEPVDVEREAEVEAEVEADIAERPASEPDEDAERCKHGVPLRRRCTACQDEDKPAPEPNGSGGQTWAELATLGEVDGVRVRLITGPDGQPWVDVRRFVKSKRYDGPTRKGLAFRASAATIMAELLLDATHAAE